MSSHVVVVGAGMGGLAAAIDLARRGVRVTVLERAAAPGGKMRRVAVAGTGIDGGPTVFTMRWVFDGLLRDAGVRLEDLLELVPVDVLARHAWLDGSRLDLHADVGKSTDAIAEFAGARAADGFRRFCGRSHDLYRTLRDTFIDAQKPSPPGLAWRAARANPGGLWNLRPWQSMWSALGDCFDDPRLRQLFGRYATYCGSSPLAAPATLMLVAHVEQAGVWRVRGGMHEVALALAAVAARHGATLRYDTHVEQLLVADGRCSGVQFADGTRLAADAVVFNGDCGAIAAGRLGAAAVAAVPAVPREARSLSAVTWCLNARTSGFPLAHHNVFFGHDYPREFQAIFGERARRRGADGVRLCAGSRRTGGRRRTGTAARAGQRASGRRPAAMDGLRAGSAGAACLCHARGLRAAGRARCAARADRPRRLRAVVPRQRRRALWPGHARTVGDVRPSRRAQPRCRDCTWRAVRCIRGRACRWPRCRDGARRRASRATSVRGSRAGSLAIAEAAARVSARRRRPAAAANRRHAPSR